MEICSKTSSTIAWYRFVDHLRGIVTSGQLYRSIASGLTLRITSRSQPRVISFCFFCRVLSDSPRADCTEFLWPLAAGNSDSKCPVEFLWGSSNVVAGTPVGEERERERTRLYFHRHWINSMFCWLENQSEDIVLNS